MTIYNRNWDFVFKSAFVVLLGFACIASAFPLSLTRSATADNVANLMQQKSGGETSQILPRVNSCIRVGSNNDTEECNSDYPLWRAISLAGTGSGTAEEVTLVDTQFDFFKAALGWTDDEVEASRLDTLRYFRDEFGVDATDAEKDPDVGGFVSASSGLMLYPVLFNFPLTKVADSADPVCCPNTTAIMGGWIADGKNLTLTGPFSRGQPILIPGEFGFFVFYIVFAPGTRFPTKLKWKSTSPVGAPANAFAFTGDMQLVDDFQEPLAGKIDGIVVLESGGQVLERHASESMESFVLRLLVMWPGRQIPRDHDSQPTHNGTI